MPATGPLMPADVPACGVTDMPEAPAADPVPATGVGGVTDPVPASGVGGVTDPIPATGVGGVKQLFPAVEVDVPPEPAFCTGAMYVTAGFAQPTKLEPATLQITINALVIVMVYLLLTF
jgi:hypothetical protein